LLTVGTVSSWPIAHAAKAPQGGRQPASMPAAATDQLLCPALPGAGCSVHTPASVPVVHDAVSFGSCP
jgi:hypothetical protein